MLFPQFVLAGLAAVFKRKVFDRIKETKQDEMCAKHPVYPVDPVKTI